MGEEGYEPTLTFPFPSPTIALDHAFQQINQVGLGQGRSRRGDGTVTMGDADYDL